MINIFDAGPKGAYDYHVRCYNHNLIFNKENNSLTIQLNVNDSLYFTCVKLESIESDSITLIGAQMIESGTGSLPPLRKIRISLQK